MTGLHRLGLSIRLARTLIEATVLSAGWLLGGTAGVGTLLFALAIGPRTQQFMKWLGCVENDLPRVEAPPPAERRSI